MKITNFTLKQFAKQPPDLITEYRTVLQYINPIKTTQKVFHMTLEEVDFIKRNLFSGDESALIEIICTVQKIKERKIKRLRIIEFFGILNSIIKQIEEISKGEGNALVSKYPDPKWEMVQGSEKMGKFGIQNTLDMLSNKDATKDDFYKKMKYSKVFLLLAKRKTEHDLEHEMSLIKIK